MYALLALEEVRQKAMLSVNCRRSHQTRKQLFEALLLYDDELLWMQTWWQRSQPESNSVAMGQLEGLVALAMIAAKHCKPLDTGTVE